MSWKLTRKFFREASLSKKIRIVCFSPVILPYALVKGFTLALIKHPKFGLQMVYGVVGVGTGFCSSKRSFKRQTEMCESYHSPFFIGETCIVVGVGIASAITWPIYWFFRYSEFKFKNALSKRYTR